MPQDSKEELKDKVTYTCPYCSRRLASAKRRIGSAIKCPECKDQIFLRGQDSADKFDEGQILRPGEIPPRIVLFLLLWIVVIIGVVVFFLCVHYQGWGQNEPQYRLPIQTQQENR